MVFKTTKSNVGNCGEWNRAQDTRGVDTSSGLTSKHGFTLLEVLALIVIVSSMVSLLFALTQAEENNEQKICMNNLKQLGLATMMYANDYDGWLFMCNDGGEYWPEKLAKNSLYIPEMHIQVEHKKTSFLWCPQDTDANDEKARPWNGTWATSYTMNDRLGSVDAPGYPAQRLDSKHMRKPVILFLDGPHYYQIDYSSPETEFSFRHNNGFNALFTDGHVEWGKRGIWGYNGNEKPEYWLP